MLAELAKSRSKIDQEFATPDLPKALEWDEHVAAGRWAIRYTVAASYQDEVDPARMRELNLVCRIGDSFAVVPERHDGQSPAFLGLNGTECDVTKFPLLHRNLGRGTLAAAQLKRVLDPYVKRLDPQLEEDFAEPSAE